MLLLFQALGVTIVDICKELEEQRNILGAVVRGLADVKMLLDKLREDR